MPKLLPNPLVTPGQTTSTPDHFEAKANKRTSMRPGDVQSNFSFDVHHLVSGGRCVIEVFVISFGFASFRLRRDTFFDVAVCFTFRLFVLSLGVVFSGCVSRKLYTRFWGGR